MSSLPSSLAQRLPDLVDLVAARGLVALRPATWLKLLLRRVAISAGCGAMQVDEVEIGLTQVIYKQLDLR